MLVRHNPKLTLKLLIALSEGAWTFVLGLTPISSAKGVLS